MSENRREKYGSIDPYIMQTPVKDYEISDLTNEDIDNEAIQIHDYSQFDYENFRDKRQVTTTETYLPTISLTTKESILEEQETEDGYLETIHPIQRDDPKPEVKVLFLVPLYVITGFFAFMLIVVPFFVTKGPNKGIVRSCIRLAAFCMWIFWFTIYFGQMHPLMGPRLENTTVAWIAYKLGNHIGNHTP